MSTSLRRSGRTKPVTKFAKLRALILSCSYLSCEWMLRKRLRDRYVRCSSLFSFSIYCCKTIGDTSSTDHVGGNGFSKHTNYGLDRSSEDQMCIIVDCRWLESRNTTTSNRTIWKIPSICSRETNLKNRCWCSARRNSRSRGLNSKK